MAVKIEKKQPKATVQINDEQEKVEEVLAPIIVDKPMANVGIKVGMTKNLGNYESLRVDVSLFMPADLTGEALDEAFDFVQNWCDLKMQSIMAEME